MYLWCAAQFPPFSCKKRSADIAGLGDNCSEHLPDICAVYSGVSQSMLETIVPKTEDACIRVVRGQYKGQVSWDLWFVALNVRTHQVGLPLSNP